MPWGYRPAHTRRFPGRYRARDLASPFGISADRVLELAREGKLPHRNEPGGEVTFPMKTTIRRMLAMGYAMRVERKDT